MSDIFISYADKDRSETEKLASALESEGWSVWWDRSIPVGKSFEDIIEEALDEAKCVVVIWSKNSVKSQWVRAEVAEAKRQGKLFPLNIDGSNPPLIYRGLQTADFRSWSGEAAGFVFKQLTTAIRGYIGAPVSKAKSGSEIKKEITDSKNGPSQSTPSNSPEISNVEKIQFDGKNLTGTGRNSDLSYEEQSALLIDLKRSLDDPGSSDDAITLLKKLRKRQDLFVNIADEIDELLQK